VDSQTRTRETMHPAAPLAAPIPQPAAPDTAGVAAAGSRPADALAVIGDGWRLPMPLVPNGPRLTMRPADPYQAQRTNTDLDAMTRRCVGCGQRKPLDEFARNRSQAQGRGYHCRPCAAALQRARVAVRQQGGAS
jgi:hypothetical protein